jgi:sugar phosphate isomerase/epimerase
MRENRSTDGRIVGYALNCFPYHTLDELWTCLETDVARLKDRAFPDGVFPVELRFSEPITRALASDCREVARLKHYLDTHDLALVTINGFVMPEFHGVPVKERVYLPAWHESGARARFTMETLDLLAQLAPVDGLAGHAEMIWSVSVPFGALKPVGMADVAANIVRCGEHAARLHERTGVRCVVALEPEPGLCVETTPEALMFFDRHVPDSLRPYLGINFDLSHQLVQFEDVVRSAQELSDAGILVAKVHVTNAAEQSRLEPFYEDSIYLHQVVGIDDRGVPAWFSLDWPVTPPPAGLSRFRCHYHLPVCDRKDTPVGTTLAEVERFLAVNPLPGSVPYIIETYTWPEQARGRERMVENICAELDWVRGKIGLSCKTEGL